MCCLFVKGPLQMTQSTINLNGTSTPTRKKRVRKSARRKMHTSQLSPLGRGIRGHCGKQLFQGLQKICSTTWVGLGPACPLSLPLAALPVFPLSIPWWCGLYWAITVRLGHTLHALMHLLHGWHENKWKKYHQVPKEVLRGCKSASF
jgi:hypothetical protein